MVTSGRNPCRVETKPQARLTEGEKPTESTLSALFSALLCVCASLGQPSFFIGLNSCLTISSQLKHQLEERKKLIKFMKLTKLPRLMRPLPQNYRSSFKKKLEERTLFRAFVAQGSKVATFMSPQDPWGGLSDDAAAFESPMIL